MAGFVIFWLIFWVAIIALVVWLVIRLFSNQRGENRPEAQGDSAEHILRERFARGEIDAEEYEHSLGVLRGKTGVQSERPDERLAQKVMKNSSQLTELTRQEFLGLVGMGATVLALSRWGSPPWAPEARSRRFGT